MITEYIIPKEQQDFYSSVIVLCAGGTINMSGTQECKPANGVKETLDKTISKLDKMGIAYQYHMLFDRAPDSSNVGEPEWEVIIEKISEIIKEKETIRAQLLEKGAKLEAGGIVIAHGTDTLHITSLVIALEFSIRQLSLPIVFTASHSTPNTPGSDANDNILKSIYIAKERFAREENLKPGVYVLIGEDIHLASRLTKVRTSPNDDGKYFYSFPSPVGQILKSKHNDFHFKINNEYLTGLIKIESNDFKSLFKRKDLYEFDGKNNKTWGIVEHVYLDKFVSIDVVQDLEKRMAFYHSAYDSKTDLGIVIQGDFKNNSKFGDIAKILHHMDQKGIIILIGSRNTFLRLIQHYEYKFLGLISKSLSHLKAKIKLAWLFKHNIQPEHILSLMDVNIAGEIFSTDILPEWIKFETFQPNKENTEVVIAYPNIHYRVLADAVKRLLLTNHNTSGDLHRFYQYKNKKLFIYGFGDGHYPTVNKPIVQIVNEFFQRHWSKSIALNSYDCLDVIIEKISQFVRQHNETIISYFEERYDLVSNKEQEILFGKLIRTKLKKENNAKIHNIISRVVSKWTEKNAGIYISEEKQQLICNFIMDNVKMTIDEKTIKKEVDKLLSHTQTKSDFKHTFSQLSFMFPDTISRRIVKDAVMESSKAMQIIGNAIDLNIHVYVRTLAVKSKSDVGKYEVGNMLMVLGADSEMTCGYSTEFFCLKQNNLNNFMDIIDSSDTYHGEGFVTYR